MMYEVWLKDDSGDATFVGSTEGPSFRDACDKLIHREHMYYKHYNSEQGTVWGCSLHSSKDAAEEASQVDGTLETMGIGPHGTADFSGSQYYKIQLSLQTPSGKSVLVDCKGVSPLVMKALRDRINELLKTHGEY
jgi:hypothetical protein